MDKATHSSRIRLGTLEDHVHTFEIPIWILKAGSRIASEMVGFIKADSGRAVPLVTVMGKGILFSTITSEWCAQRTKYPLSISNSIE
jgi:hypothetical protein